MFLSPDTEALFLDRESLRRTQASKKSCDFSLVVIHRAPQRCVTSLSRALTHEKKRSMRLRLVEIKTADQHLFLVTNLALEIASAELVGTIYRRRWSIELFFRWIKCILGCRHFFAESPQGVAMQIYLALIAALLFQNYTGRRPNKRTMELIQMYFLGWVSAEELAELLQKQVAREPSRKKG
jgi:IS4 transposase